MDEIFDAGQIAEAAERDLGMLDDFIIKAPEYFRKAAKGVDISSIRDKVQEVRKAIRYWENQLLTDPNLSRARIEAEGLERAIKSYESKHGSVRKGNGVSIYDFQAIVDQAISEKNDAKLRAAYARLEGTGSNDQRIGGMMRLIDAYFRNKAEVQKKRQERKDDRKRKKLQKASEPSEQYDSGEHEIVIEPNDDGNDIDEEGLEKALEGVKPVIEVSLPDYDRPSGGNGKGRNNGGIEPPLRSRGFDPSKSKFKPEPVPRYSFADIVGLDDVKEQIKVKMVYPYTMPDRAKAHDVRGGGGILLYGPPGTGKTSMARAVAGELGIPLFKLRPTDIIVRSAEKTVENITELFEVVRSYERSVIFFDEVDIFFPPHPNTNPRIMANTTFQTELSGFDSQGYENSDSKLLLIGATNKPWAISSAMLRFERFGEKIYVGFPDADAREGLFRLNLMNKDLAGDIDYKTLAEWTSHPRHGDVYSGADIAQICARAAESCLAYEARQKEAGIVAIERKRIDMQLLSSLVDEIVPTGLRPNAYDSRQMDTFRQEI